ncbi:hypothetical protein [Actinoallomurus soli]|nr:hypothetical protein [Actinoallomurus soli]MCO5970654.1 hypothetical protein [Actinoallomurus soli]
MSTVTADHPQLDALNPSLDLGEFMIEGTTGSSKAGTLSDFNTPQYFWV